jgi:FkbM family methyltransferase
MTNSLKKGLFSFYTTLAHSGNGFLRKVGYKFGQNTIKPLGKAVYERNGVKLKLSPLNMIDKAIISRAGHDKVVEEQIEKQLKNGGAFLDIGANWGYFSILAASKPNTQVLAFEPSLKELALLYDHILLNRYTNIWAFPFGLSSEVSSQKLYLGADRNTGTNSLVNKQGDAYVEAMFAPLYNVVPPDFISRIRLCKIDVEGYELFVLQGMETIMPQLKDCNFVIEITPEFLAMVNHTAKDIYDFFARHGYVGLYGLDIDGQYDEVFYKK